MADTITPLLQLVDQETGNNDNTWGDIADANFLKLENAIAGRSSIGTTGGTTTLTDEQARPRVLVLTGTLVSNAEIHVPARSKEYLVTNATTGNFTVTVKTPAGTGIIVGRDRTANLYCDGTNVDYVENGGVPIGSFMDFGNAAVPTNYLQADGTAVSRTTYARLFAKYSTNFGTGDGSTTFNLPNLTDKYRRGSGAFAVGASVAQDIQSHTHTASSSSSSSASSSSSSSGFVSMDVAGEHAHSDYYQATSVQGTATIFQGTGASNFPITGIQESASFTNTGNAGSHYHATSLSVSTTTSTSVSTATTTTITATGGTETRPNSVAVLMCVRYQ